MKLVRPELPDFPKASLIQKESSALTEKTRLNERDSKQLLNLLVLLSNSVNLDDASSALNNNIPNIFYTVHIYSSPLFLIGLVKIQIAVVAIIP